MLFLFHSKARVIFNLARARTVVRDGAGFTVDAVLADPRTTVGLLNRIGTSGVLSTFAGLFRTYVAALQDFCCRKLRYVAS